MIDTHCHLFKEYYDNLDELLNNIKNSSVKKVIVNGFDMKSNLEVLELVNKYDFVYGALGFHPTEKIDDLNEAIEFLKLHINDKKIVAVGEIGLDYHYDDTDKNKQISLFKKQLDIASLYSKPVIVHSRDAIQDTYDILKKYNLKGSIHCFSGSLEMAKEFIKIGYFIGIGGVCTFKNSKEIKKVIENIPLTSILLETDSPYLSPEPFRGSINSSLNIPIICKKISELKNIDYSTVSEQAYINSLALFDIK